MKHKFCARVSYGLVKSVKQKMLPFGWNGCL